MAGCQWIQERVRVRGRYLVVHLNKCRLRKKKLLTIVNCWRLQSKLQNHDKVRESNFRAESFDIKRQCAMLLLDMHLFGSYHDTLVMQWKYYCCKIASMRPIKITCTLTLQALCPTSSQYYLHSHRKFQAGSAQAIFGIKLNKFMKAEQVNRA